MSLKKSKTKTPKNIIDSLPDLTKVSVPAEFFYGAFLSVTLLLSGLLMGSANKVEVVQMPVATLSPSELRLERDVSKIVEGYPIQEMLPYIVKHDRKTAAFIVGIAKKESNWGKRVPVTENGEDCYNYWGYRGEGSRGTAMGHGCFGSKKEAVAVISKRIDNLMKEYHRDTAEEMVVWKCGYTCDGHSKESVDSWIDDVSYYADQVQKNPKN